jgi:hypothetical protein
MLIPECFLIYIFIMIILSIAFSFLLIFRTQKYKKNVRELFTQTFQNFLHNVNEVACIKDETRIIHNSDNSLQCLTLCNATNDIDWDEIDCSLCTNSIPKTGTVKKECVVFDDGTYKLLSKGDNFPTTVTQSCEDYCLQLVPEPVPISKPDPPVPISKPDPPVPISKPDPPVPISKPDPPVPISKPDPPPVEEPVFNGPKDLSELKKWSESGTPTLLNNYCKSNMNLRKGQFCVADCSQTKGQKPWTIVGDKLIQDDNKFNWLNDGQLTSFPQNKTKYCENV